MRASPRTWLLRAAAAVAVPAALLLALEAGLRLAGYGRPSTFLIPDSKPGYFRSNPDFASLFLPGNFDLRPLNFRDYPVTFTPTSETISQYLANIGSAAQT